MRELRWYCMGAALVVAVAVALIVASAAYGWWSANATSYCLRGRMADGTYVRAGSAASNRHRLGTRIRIVGRTPGPGGRRLWVIRDRIGHGSQLDFWTASCGEAIQFGRRNVRYVLGWR